MDRLLLTAEEVAEVLNVGRCKVYDLIRNGEIESIKIGRLRRIPVNNVRKFAERLIEEGRA
ncbi:helix-turn-helix domain-containing protein [Pseudonocardia sp.]|jgi:excisionase family DNA binding protein|uniref:helix-turn-helix domain-containing protein n=1 Tax=Pseudonocardia sp. TaxID=60912 RepID=UPI002621AA68|nr:helix-turn-helix domain-containing protein [Pseudonocardia sp.]MCW2722321.1 binding domain protein excisionase family [Pseudonocardia sp.]